MANLKSIAEAAWKQCFPNQGDEGKITREQFIATAKTEYAVQLWQKLMAEKAEDGIVQVPSYLLSEVTLPVVDNQIDVSGLKIMRGIDSTDIWLQDVGGPRCKCRYIRTSFNNYKLLCDDDSINSEDRLYYPGANKTIKFPQGTKDKELLVTYAGYGENINDSIEVDDIVGGIVRRSLVELYLGKTGTEDETNNSNSSQ